MPAPKKDANTPAPGLGTFAGVFTPSILTILGIILFLRLGYVVGSAGLWKTLIIIGLANAISVLTSISLAAAATNFKVKGGGVYYLISRTLGSEYGGAIGIVLFLAQAVSIAFYCIGLGEVTAAFWEDGPTWRVQLIALAAVSILFVFAWLGADWATRFQYLVMAVLGAALVSFFVGGLSQVSWTRLAASWTGPDNGPPFWIVFAIFFPAVTGFTQGVSMSGDLRDPERSLVKGTFWAVGLSIIVYFGVALVLAGAVPLEELAGDYEAVKKAAFYPPLMTAGVIAATISSAMASFLGAPRILQSLAGDKIFRLLNPFAQGVGPANNPRKGVLLTAVIAYAAVGFGRINLIAPVVSMFFLISYGLLNYAAYYEARSKSPSFRPRFRYFNHRLSLIGGLTCLGAMLAIDPTAGAVAAGLLFGLHQYLKRLDLPLRWADSQTSHHLQMARDHLIAAGREVDHPRNWRPQILALSANPDRRERLIRFGHWLGGRSGVKTVVNLIQAKGAAQVRSRDKAGKELAQFILNRELPAFPLAVAVEDIDQGLPALVQAYGVGPLSANLVLVNRPEPSAEEGGPSDELRYADSLRNIYRLGYNVVVLAASEEQWTDLGRSPARERRIDVLWSDDPTGRLMLLLAHLITRSPFWAEAAIRLISPCKAEDDRGTEMLEQLVEDYRIEAEIAVLPPPWPENLVELNRGSSLLLAPFKLRGTRIEGPFEGRLPTRSPRLPITALVLADTDIDLAAEPDEGKAAEISEALDALQKAGERLDQARKNYDRLLDAAEQAQTAAGKELSPEEQVDLSARFDEANLAVEQAFRHLAKEQAKEESCRQRLESLGVKPPGRDREEDRDEADETA